MRRALFTLVAAAVLCAWAGAQGTAPLSSADQVKLLKANRILIGNLVDDGLALANAGNETERAAACRGTALSLANALKSAARDEDADRVAELVGLMTAVVRDGLVPNLEVATRTVQPDSPQAAKLAEVKKNAAQDIDDVRSAIPAGGKLADNQKVNDAVGALAALKPHFLNQK